MVKAGTGIIIRRNGLVLVGRRKGSHGSGRLAFPGGHIDDTDISLEYQVAREALEETGMIVDMVDIDPGRQDLFTTFDILGEGNRYLTAYMVADYVSGGVPIGDGDSFAPIEDKCEGWDFVTLDELAEMVSKEPDQSWIPIDRIVHYRSVIGL